MHRTAEYGVAAHWRYKEKGSQKADAATDKQFSWLHKLVEYDKEVSSAKDFILRSEFAAKVAKPQRDGTDEETSETTLLDSERKKQPRQRISVKDNVRPAPQNVEPRAGTIKYRGFEENNVF